MPGIDGVALLQEALRLHPLVPLMLMSERATAVALEAYPAYAAFDKPLDHEPFVQTLKEAIQQPSASGQRALRELFRRRLCVRKPH